MAVDEQKKLAVWDKGHVIPGHDPAVWRHDDFGRTIRYGDFQHPSQFGWDMFPIRSIGIFDFAPVSISNLRPLRCNSTCYRLGMARWM
jgi:hypothetical protein